MGGKGPGSTGIGTMTDGSRSLDDKRGLVWKRVEKRGDSVLKKEGE